MLKIAYKQSWHLLLLTILISLIFFFTNEYPTILLGELWNISTVNWIYLTLLIPIIHQIYVLVCWRSELYYKTISIAFNEQGFKLYKIGFAILIFSRPVSITLLAISNCGTIQIQSELSYLISFILCSLYKVHFLNHKK